MRIVIAHPGPQFSVHDVFEGWREALTALGHKVIVFNLHDRLTLYDTVFFQIEDGKFRKALTAEQSVEFAINGLNATLYKTTPDLLIVVSGFLVPGELLDNVRRYPTKVVVLHTESPYESSREIELAQHADINLLNDPVHLDRFPAGSYYQPHSYRPTVHYPGPGDPDLAADLAFIGTGFASRVALFEAMCANRGLDGLDVLLAGNWQQTAEDSPLRKYIAHDIEDCCDNAQAAQIYRAAKIGINLYRREHENDDHADGWAIGPREVEMAASGIPFLRDPRGEGDELFPTHLKFSSAEEAVEGLRWWLTHPNQREAASEAGRAAIADRTFTQAAVRLLNRIERGN